MCTHNPFRAWLQVVNHVIIYNRFIKKLGVFELKSIKKIGWALIFALSITLGLATSQPAQAAITENSFVDSHFIAAPIYDDQAATTMATDKLDSKLQFWHVFEIGTTATGASTYCLGHNQWVKASDLKPTLKIQAITSTDTRLPGFQTETYTASFHHPYTIYRDPQLTEPIGQLNPNVEIWRVLKTASDAFFPYAYDLGDNQWVSAADVWEFQNFLSVPVGSALVNLTNVEKATQTAKKTDFYAALDFKSLNGVLYAKLGTNDQWIGAGPYDRFSTHTSDQLNN